MTVSSSINRVSYAGNGSTTVFPYTYKIFEQDDLTVILRAANGTETVQTITSQYTVSGVGNAGGGNVTMLTAPATGETLVILRVQDLVQELDIVPNDPFSSESLEGALDRLTFMVQQHEETLGRTIKASRTNTIAGSEFTISAADRANKIFAFDSSGNVSIAQELGTYRGNWAASTAFAQRDIIKDTTNDNIYICLVAHTSTGALPITSNVDVAKWALLVDAAAASSSASAASSSASAAAASEANAAASEAAAGVSEANAAASEAAAGVSETNAAASEAAAAASYDDFDDRYLGAKATDPTLDNDGDALIDGALYFDTANNVMKVYDLGTTTWLRTTPTSGDQANINTVTGIAANVTTVAGISADVTTVAGISADVTSVAADATDIGTVATNIANVNTVAGISGNVTTVAGISADVTAVAGDATDIGVVATNITNVNTVAGISANVTTVAGISADVTAVAGDATDIGTVSSNIANVNTVAGISSAVTTVAADGTDIGVVAANSTNINTVAGISANVTTVAGISANVTTVAGISADVTSLATSIGSIDALTYSDLLPIEVLHPVAFTVPRGFWDTGERLFSGASERMVISNWNVEADLLAGAIDGTWYNITGLFTDTSGTVAVTATGQEVRNMTDQTGADRAATGSGGLYATVPRPAIFSNAVSSTLVVDLPYLGNDCTIGYSTDQGTTILTGQTVGGRTEVLIDRYLFGYVIVDRAISVEQTARLTQYLDALRLGYVAPAEYAGVLLLETGDALLFEDDDRVDLQGVISYPLNTAA
jgi:hypothetical protein